MVYLKRWGGRIRNSGKEHTAEDDASNHSVGLDRELVQAHQILLLKELLCDCICWGHWLVV